MKKKHLYYLLAIICVLTLCGIGFATSAEENDSASTTKSDKPKSENNTTTKNNNPKVTQAPLKGDGQTQAQKPVAEVMVIASRLPSAQEKMNDMALNVTYKDQNELIETHPTTFQDAVRDIEGGIFFDAVGNGVDETFSLRGFSDPSAVVYLVDGVRVNDIDDNRVKFPLIPMRDVQSVQIERGSASSVYGSNAFAGVVNITTGQPSAKPIKLFGGLEWTSFHGLRFNQGVSGTIKDRVTPLGGKLSYYFNGERDDTNGFRDHSNVRLTSFDIKTAYELPDEQGKIYFGLKHIEDAINLPGEITLQQFQAGDLRVSNKPLDGWKFKNTIVQLGADKKFWEDRITASIMASERFNHRKAFSTYGTFTGCTSSGWPCPAADVVDPYTNFINTNATDKDLTWQLKYSDSWKQVGNDSLIGMEYRRGHQLTLQRFAYGGNVQEWIAPSSDHSATSDNVALFWRETLKFWDKIIPYFGMRHDFNWLKTDDEVTPTNGISERWDKSTLSTGVTVKPAKWVDVFGNYSQGFRVPTMDETVPYAGANQTSLLPEKSDSYESGTRLRYKNYGEYKFSYFLIDVKDQITWDNVKNQYFNIAQTRRYGLEQRIDLTPVQEVKLYGTYTWTLAYVHNDGDSSLAKHRSLGQIPENRFTLGGNITPLKRLGSLYEGLRIGFNGVFTGRQHPSNYESSSEPVLNATGGAGHWIKSYSVWNFILSYVWKNQEIYFKINNLFNKRYYSYAYSGTSDGTSIYPTGTYTWVSPGAGREFVLGSKWEF